jgi:hypothetical protein
MTMQFLISLPCSSVSHKFSQVQEEANATASFVDIKFSNDGKYIMAAVEGRVYILDAFNGSVVRKFMNGATSEGCVPLEACISGDNKYLLQGSKWSHS